MRFHSKSRACFVRGVVLLYVAVMQMKNILERIEKFKDSSHVAVIDGDVHLTYKDLIRNAKTIGSSLRTASRRNTPMAVMLEKSAACLEAMLGIVYSGHWYVVIDDKMPAERVAKIFEGLAPTALITDAAHREKADALGVPVFDIDELKAGEIDSEGLRHVRAKQIDTDVLYALYTSGSTGMPKGAVLSHRNVLNYIDWVIDTFHITDKTIYGSQTPFYFSMSVTDVYSTLFTGATIVLLPKKYFAFPKLLVELMNETHVNTIYWVPSALGFFMRLNVLEFMDVPDLKRVMFAGEAMPCKYLNYWMDHRPDIKYANLYGPTETTDICTYYKVDRRFANDESLPIGRHCDNCDVFILDDNNNEITGPDVQGELCVRGGFLAYGYYNNPEKTAAAFMQNPLNTAFPEMMYRTGDLVKYNERGEIIYITRKDYQIKHMGYRIELGEIETAVYGLDAIKACVVVYDDAKDKIVLIYQGKMSDKDITDGLKDKLPNYMMPNIYIRTRNMPMNQNGKIDRKYLKENYGGMMK